MNLISQSQINLYRICPHAYELKYRYNCEPMMFDPLVTEVGKKVHEVIDIYYKHYYNSTYRKEEIKNITYNILRNQWDTMLPASLLKKAYLCICNFAKFESENNGKLATKPLTEVKIYSEDLMGIVDYLDLNKQKAIDFKTNARAGISRNYKLQAIMYQKLIKDRFNINIEKFGFQFLYVDDYKEVSLYDPKLKEIAEELILNKDRIKESWQTMIFPKNPEDKSYCRRCEYRFYCEGIEER